MNCNEIDILMVIDSFWRPSKYYQDIPNIVADYVSFAWNLKIANYKIHFYSKVNLNQFNLNYSAIGILTIRIDSVSRNSNYYQNILWHKIENVRSFELEKKCKIYI